MVLTITGREASFDFIYIAGFSRKWGTGVVVGKPNNTFHSFGLSISGEVKEFFSSSRFSFTLISKNLSACLVYVFLKQLSKKAAWIQGKQLCLEESKISIFHLCFGS